MGMVINLGVSIFFCTFADELEICIMNEINTYLVHWAGPFTPEEVLQLEQENKWIYELYLIKGKVNNCKKCRYYCGEALSRGAGERFKDGNHHIKDFKEVEEIWAGYIASNLKPKQSDVFAVEKIITAYLKEEVGNNFMLNQTNKKFPKYDVCVINRWYKRDGETVRLKLKVGSPSKIIPAVLLHYAYGKIHEIHGSQRIKHLKVIEE